MSKYTCPHKIYKYISYDGLEKTLTGQSFKLSRPTDFNDPLDMYLQETIGMDFNEFLPGIQEEFKKLITGEVDPVHLREGPYKQLIITMNLHYRAASDEDKKRFLSELDKNDAVKLYDLEKLRGSRDQVVQTIQKAFQTDGIFCSTIDKDNLLMWSHYADHHKGAVVEFTPNIGKDSVFLVSRPVSYKQVRPVPYRTPADFLRKSLFMSAEESIREIIDELVYTKSVHWEYEREYRLYVPMLIRENEPFATLKYHAEELTAIFFGCRMPENQRKAASALA